MWPDIRRIRMQSEPESDDVMLTICMELLHLRVNRSVLMSVIRFVLLLHIVMHNICLFECQLVLTNDLELTRFYDIYALILLYR